MHKKMKNSTILIIGLIFILVGIFVCSFEYFRAKKDKAFANMNIMLFEKEMPSSISSNEELLNSDVTTLDSTNEEVKEEVVDRSKLSYDYIGILEIPKINLKRGFVSQNSKYNRIDYNITIINGSNFPDQKVNNNLIFAAHSGYCYICYFDKLYKLGKGDIAYLYYKSIKYTYKITDNYEVKKNGKVAIRRDTSKSTMTLITCTRNSDTKQSVYILELQNKKNY